MSPIEAAVLRSVVLPSVLVGVAVLAAGWASNAWRGRLQSLALGLGFALGSYLLLFNLGFPPTDVNESYTYVALMLAAFPWIAPRSTGGRYGARFVCAAVGTALLMYHIRTALTNPTELRNLVAFICLCAGAWSITDTARTKVRGVTLLVVPMTSAIAVSALLMIKGSAVFAQLNGVLCGLLGATLAAVIGWPKRVDLDAVVPFASAMIVFFMMGGLFYLDINPWTLIALAWPFLLLHLRPYLPGLRRPAVEALVLFAFAAGPVGAYVYKLLQDAGPLY